ncbi:MAG TPA: ankyrin repeat domain-containing protein [Acidimicrobiales bacterium]|nr:ankyrin repeat domain-containing protein [Acidimicrobiales bacterium]
MAQTLFEAIESGDLEAVRALVGEHPELASDRNTQGVSAVLAAQYRRQQDITEVLVAARGDLDVFEAAAVGDTERLLALVNESRAAVNAWSADGFTPLQLAAFFGRTGAVRLLLNNQADVAPASKNDMKVHALNSAVAGGNVEIVTLLLEAGADPNAPQAEGWTPLRAAEERGDEQIVTALREHGAA